MTTLLTMHTSHGIVGRCDANCYNATTKACTCICGGRNHGVGLNRAIENTRKLPPDFQPPPSAQPDERFHIANHSERAAYLHKQLDLFDDNPEYNPFGH